LRRKPLEQLKAEVDHAIADCVRKTANFMDLEFSVFKDRVLELCRRLTRKNYDFRWTSQTRFDLVYEELLGRMKGAGGA
jgi:radical SAM superfamily enzyme YgiQ (UPF0313 family)